MDCMPFKKCFSGLGISDDHLRFQERHLSLQVGFAPPQQTKPTLCLRHAGMQGQPGTGQEHTQPSNKLHRAAERGGEKESGRILPTE